MGRSHVQNGQISEQIDGVNGNAVFPLFRVVEGSFPHVVELGGNINDHVGVSSRGDQSHRLVDFAQFVGIGDNAEGKRPWPSREKKGTVGETIDSRGEDMMMIARCVGDEGQLRILRWRRRKMRFVGEIGLPGGIEGDDHILLTETEQVFSAAMMQQFLSIAMVNGRERRGKRTEVAILLLECN